MNRRQLLKTEAVLAEAVKAPEVTKAFETAGSPVAYLQPPEFQKFVTQTARG
jgi:tripartite-type tricarboxylate transporter receptor subunit TctC